MPTPAEVINMVASLMNDTKQTSYTDEACLPYLNVALDELQEIMEENNIPITNEVSSTITLPAGTTVLGFSTTPALPSGLIEIQELWESNDGGVTFIGPMGTVDFIPVNLQLSTNPVALFGVYAWMDNEIQLPYSSSSIILKINYIKSLFSTPIALGAIDTELGVKFKNIKIYLGYETAALCSMFIGENETRAAALHTKAEEALERTLNIPTKGRQGIVTRRKPFRAGFKMRGSF